MKFTVDIQVERPAAVVFDYTQDYSNRLQWDTFLKEARLINGATAAGNGVRAWCVARNGLGMETEYVSFNRPRVTAVKMTRGPYMFRHFSGSWRFRALDASTTEVIFVYSFRLRFPFNLAMPFIRRHLRRQVQQRLSDLKQCVELA